jgi:DNA-binding CsgD family transcriptional regulator/tetratricopeptide (TPR) repeat protein
MATPGEAECAVLGRHVELDTFRGLLEDLVDGRGRCVLVEGEPGIGKTALLDAALARARTIAGLTVCSAACDALPSQAPLSVLLRALSSNSSPDTDDTESAARPTHSTHPVPPDGFPLASAVERVFALIGRRSAEGPLLLAVDDLHEADEASLLVWQRLCAATTRTPLLLVGTLRPVPRRGEVDRLRRILKANAGVSLPLAPLTADEVTALARHLLNASPGPRLTERLASAAGNPLYVHELVDALVGARAIVFADGNAKDVELADTEPRFANRNRPDPMGDALAAAVTDRLAFLGPETLEVLRVATLLGPEFAVTDLSAALHRPVGLLALAVQETVTAGIVEPVGLRLRFRHGLLRQALYCIIPRPERAALRQAAARALMENAAPVERVAELIIGDLGAADGWETEWAARHADDLARRSPELAARLFEHILGHGDPDDVHRAALLDGLADLYFTLARYDQAAERAGQILDHTRDPNRQGHATWIAANALARLGRVAEGEDLLARAESDPQLPEIWRARLLARSPHALSRGEHLSDPMTIGYVLYAQSHARFQASDMLGCSELANRALALGPIANQPSFTDLRLLLYTLRISALTNLDRFDEAADTLRTARTVDERVGPARLAPYAIAAAELAYQQGRWDDALTELAAIRGVPTSALHPRNPDAFHGLAALIAVRRDDQHKAEHHLDALSSTASPTAALARALYEERAGRPERALTTLHVAIQERSAPPESASRIASLLPPLVRLAIAQNDISLATTAAETAAESAQGYVAQWCLALINNDPDQLDAPADHLRAVGRIPDLAWALEDLAVLRIRDGAAPARRTLAEARALSTEYGAAWDVRRATARLRAHGVRPGNRTTNRPRTGPQALTETERRIADLVAQSMSNPDIAAIMSLSRRTIETHVSRILAKLGARSRREVAEALRPAE